VPPLDEVAAETYYDLRAGYADSLTIPAELSRFLDTFSGLEGNDRERFLRACFWYHTASTVWDYSQSLHLTSLVNAIECLATVGPERSKPEGPSGLFLSFMRKFAPGSRVERYSTRSTTFEGRLHTANVYSTSISHHRWFR
jgi:hypothetical protein